MSTERLVDLSLFPLLRKQYVVERGSVTRLTIHVVLDEAVAPTSRSCRESEETSAEPVDYLIRQFSISDAQMRFEDRRQRLDVRLPVTASTCRGNRSAGIAYACRRRRPGPAPGSAGGHRAYRGRPGDRPRRNPRATNWSWAPPERASPSPARSMQFENPRYDLALNADVDVEPLACSLAYRTLRAVLSGRKSRHADRWRR